MLARRYLTWEIEMHVQVLDPAANCATVSPGWHAAGQGGAEQVAQAV